MKLMHAKYNPMHISIDINHYNGSSSGNGAITFGFCCTQSTAHSHNAAHIYSLHDPLLAHLIKMLVIFLPLSHYSVANFQAEHI